MDTQDLQDKHYTLVTDALIQTIPAHIKAGIDKRQNRLREQHTGQIKQEARDVTNESMWRHAAWLVYSHRFDVPENLVKNLPHLSQHFDWLRKDGEVRRAIRNWYIDVNVESDVSKWLVDRCSKEKALHNAQVYKGNVLWANLMIENTCISFAYCVELLYHLVRWQSYIIQVESGGNNDAK